MTNFIVLYQRWLLSMIFPLLDFSLNTQTTLHWIQEFIFSFFSIIPEITKIIIYWSATTLTLHNNNSDYQLYTTLIFTSLSMPTGTKEMLIYPIPQKSKWNDRCHDSKAPEHHLHHSRLRTQTNSTSQSYWACIRWAEHTSPIHGDPTPHSPV